MFIVFLDLQKIEYTIQLTQKLDRLQIAKTIKLYRLWTLTPHLGNPYIEGLQQAYGRACIKILLEK